MLANTVAKISGALRAIRTYIFTPSSKKDARRILKNIPHQIKLGQLEAGAVINLCSVSIAEDLSKEAQEAMLQRFELPSAVEDFLPNSTPYLVTKALVQAGEHVYVEPFRYGEHSICGINFAADPQDSIRLRLNYVVQA